ncbi:hypothetical protein FXO38_26159 [Capsicum annuum]|nr:hypothetical protein FXO38_26159 [Capsicum annuum]
MGHISPSRVIRDRGSEQIAEFMQGDSTSRNSFNLKVLNVIGCDNLMTLLPLELVQQLKNLEELELQSCSMLEEIVTEVENEEGIQENNGEVVLPSLRKLRLVSMPRLRSICRDPMICDSLTTIEVVDCPELEILPFFLEIRPQLVDSLKQIKGSRISQRGSGHDQLQFGLSPAECKQFWLSPNHETRPRVLHIE